MIRVFKQVPSTLFCSIHLYACLAAVFLYLLPEDSFAAPPSEKVSSNQALGDKEPETISPPFDASTPSSVDSDAPLICPRGFEINIVADDSLVHDAFSLTTDGKGNPVVSGPGYIRTLVDCDENGRYRRAVDLNVNIVQGAQGLWCDVGKYYYVADGGLWVATDANGDFIADGSPQKVFAIPTGGEHDAHAIRRGPDGWWYLIVGNFAANIARLKNDPYSPVEYPRAGTLWRISPDFNTRGVWAHGLRNAYDFDFLADGSIVTYDSDEERELTLPWYRQTRVSILTAGSDAGWLDSAWSDLATRVTMPQVISNLGRGSPTGVKVYDHTAFPKKYHNAVFVEDWTFGRILAIYPQPKDPADSDRAPARFMAETFVQTTGTTGFAPTDLTVAQDGSLLVCSGGRGTTGTLYRIFHSEKSSNNTSASESRAASDVLSSLLLPSPGEAWSRSKWEPIWKKTPLNQRLDAIRGKFDTSESLVDITSKESEIEHRPFKADLPRIQRRAIQFEIDLQNRGFLSNSERVSLSELMKIAVGIPVNMPLPAGKAPSSPHFAPSVRHSAWWGIGHSSIRNNPAFNKSSDANISGLLKQLSELSEAQLAACFDSRLKATDHQDLEIDPTLRFEQLAGEPIIRAFYECIGLQKSSLPPTPLWLSHQRLLPRENDSRPLGIAPDDNKEPVHESGNAPRTIETQRSVRQIQLWAAYRATLNTTDTNPLPKEITYDLAVSKRLYGMRSSRIDADLMDQLARRSSQRQIPQTIPDVLEALVVLQSALGDYRHAIPTHQPPPVVEAFDGYKSTFGAQVPPAIREGWAKWCMIVADGNLRPNNAPFSANQSDNNKSARAWDASVAPEAIRTLAMLTPSSPEAVSFCLAKITPNSHPTSDIHSLVALASCNGTRNAEQTIATANAATGILTKVRTLSLNTESRWSDRLQEIWQRLVMKDPNLQPTFVSRPTFGVEDDLFWLRLCPEQIRTLGRNRLKQTLLRTSPNNWEQGVTQFVWEDPKAADKSLTNFLRESISKQNAAPKLFLLELLSQAPIQADYNLFANALESSERDFRTVGWKGISKLAPENPAREMVALTSLWNRIKDSTPSDISPNSVAVRLRRIVAKQGAPNVPASENWNDWEPFLKKTLGDRFPKLVAKADRPSVEWLDRVLKMNTLKGDGDRGRLIYQQAKCASCHGGGNGNSSNALGPSLTGVTRRFSSKDLFQSIFEPNHDISDRYRSTKVLTKDGTVIVGMKIYDSVDGVTLQLANGNVSRINQDDIEEKGFSDQSLMPAGLLDDRPTEDLADLYSYLKSL